MIIEGEDGVTHINIYSKGKTPLGVWLSNFTHQQIAPPEHGEFASIEAYWYWLGCEDDSLRQLHGWKAKAEGRKLERPIHRDNFEDLIRAAIDLKLKSNRAMLMELARSIQPLCHYYEYQGRRIDAGYEWMVQHFENRREQLQVWLQHQGL